MNNKNQKPINKLLVSRSGLLEIIIMALLISSGINLVTTGISTKFVKFNDYITYAGVIFVIIGLVYLTFKVFGNRSISHTSNGFFVYHKLNKKLVPVNRYQVSSSLSDYIKALFTENKALSNMWNKEDFTDRYIVENDMLIKKEIKSDQLLVEAIEYFVISRLSTHLTDYFNKFNNSDKLKTFIRNEVPDVLLSNRFLELFSKPMEEREPFADFTDNNTEKNRKTVMAFSEGAFFDHFELTLPKKSVVRRRGKNQVEISTNRFKMKIETMFDGMGESLPYKFEKYYLLLDKFSEISVYNFQVKVDIRFNLLSLFSFNGWRYYQWVDSFLLDIDKKINKVEFFNKINWDSNVTLYEMMDNKFKSEMIKEAAAVSE